jgi:hypothetical protein
MWLIHRDTDGNSGDRIPLPASLHEALVRWYVGDGSFHDEQAGVTLVQNARIGHRWIACGCLGPGNLPKHMQQMVAVFDQLGGDVSPIYRHFQVTVAGWSDTLNSWASGIASTYETRDPDDVTGLSHLNGYQPFIPYQGAPVCCVPAVESEVLGRDVVTQDDINGLDPERDALLLVQAQRLTPVIDGTFQVQYLVDGFAELVTLSAQGVSRKILCEWPDECGKLITPEGAPTRQEVKDWIAEQRALATAEDQTKPELVVA